MEHLSLNLNNRKANPDQIEQGLFKSANLPNSLMKAHNSQADTFVKSAYLC